MLHRHLTLSWLLCSALGTLGALSVAACGSIDIPTSTGGCQTDSDCGQGAVCVEEVCTTSSEDTDQDGLTNGMEMNLGTNPALADTDGDGIDDKAEISDLSDPADSDGDGVIDALESNGGDKDEDCIADQFDANDASDTAVVKKLELCALEGVCAGDVQPKAECAPAAAAGDEPTWFCSYGGVVGYNPGPDNMCDGLDNDCDGVADEDFVGAETECGEGACGATGAMTCVDGVEVDGCEPLAAEYLNDKTCDGIDEDCDGETDEEYVGPDGFCGTGACTRSGSSVCFNGVPTLDCIEGAPAANDETCDGVDDDCDELIDEDFDGATTTCGSGGCLTTGKYQCQDGVEIDDCVAGTGLPTDATCDGVDDDCDGETDEEYVSDSGPTSCGVGACASEGTLVCVGGDVQDTCIVGTPGESDTSCDNVDNDCNGETDEGYVAQETSCGTGSCQASGLTACAEGIILDNCVALSPETDLDTTCDGVDDNCNGETDEDFEAGVTSCGKGVCASEGDQTCQAGVIVDTCKVGEVLDGEFDASCDGADQDCDGKVDEGFVSEDTSCGEGVCLGLGTSTCVDGVPGDTCIVGAPVGQVDGECDDQDQDCDGLVDEDFAPAIVACGAGVCAGSGVTSCNGGEVVDSCSEGEGLAIDASCDGEDNDCDDAFDEDYASVEVTCGLGVCAKTVMTSCVQGSEISDCAPSAPAGADDSCNGLDDDCDGATDEGFSVESVTCGVGACQSVGNIVCVDGVEENTCEVGFPGPNDASCNGVDNDCDDAVDEDFLVTATACGVGVCAAAGERVCKEGQVADTCAPLEATGPDITCDGLDDDCDGTTDEDYVTSQSMCGDGACASIGQRTCIGGVENDTCEAGQPALADATCDGVDDDCDGTADQDYVAFETTCGVGACESSGTMACVDGTPVNSCEPATAAPSDVTCDGVDDNCNGQTDEEFSTESITCGTGACLANGTRTCSNGATVDNCVEGTAAASDATCDGVDDDCSGATDEDYVETVTSCGDGACAAAGALICVAGEETSTCVEVEPNATDDDCDGVDDDCNGETDEGYVPQDFPCGVGECARVGQTFCQGGNELNDCSPGAPAPDDSDDCDGKDNDCNGDTDEDYVSQTTSCGDGVCQSSGVTSCVSGQVQDSCQAPTAPAGDTDSDCNGLDSDCDGEIDEGYVSVEVTCGAGVCQNTGQKVCQGAPSYEVNTCEPLTTTSTADYVCNGLDDDCDGETDEDYVSVQTECGKGVCATTSMSVCEPSATGGPAAGPSDNCVPPEPSTTEQDASCNAADDDCDGETDEGFVASNTTCGLGICNSQGVTSCGSGGVQQDSCQPGSPTLAVDGTIALDECGGGDSDCDGETDEDFFPTQLTCGTGTCAMTVTTSCSSTGQVNDSCTPSGEPSCENKACGDDGCGGSCGDCAANELCTANFTCQCVPSCLNKGCGSDGCGGTCGDCPNPDPCQVGVCNSSGTCSFTNLEDWTSCDDGSDETIGDFCASGTCVGYVYRDFQPAIVDNVIQSEQFVDASRRLGGGVHAVYTSRGGNPFTGETSAAVMQSCIGGLSCSTHVLGHAGEAQAVSPVFQHVGGQNNVSDGKTLSRTVNSGYAFEGNPLQEVWLNQWDEVPNITAIAGKGDEWVAAAYMTADGKLAPYLCTVQSCALNSPPAEVKYSAPVRMRNVAGEPVLAVNPESEKPILLAHSASAGWQITHQLDTVAQVYDFTTIVDSNGSEYHIGVGRLGLLFWGWKGSTGLITVDDGSNDGFGQTKISFFSVSRFGDWLVAFGLHTSGQYVVAYAPWSSKAQDGNQWAIRGTKIFNKEPIQASRMQSDNDGIYVFGTVPYESVDQRAMYYAGAYPDFVVINESFNSSFALAFWESFVSCSETEWSSEDSAATLSGGCSDPDSIEEELELPGALLWRPIDTGEQFTLTVTARADDDDGYGVTYATMDEKNHYRVRLDKQRGSVRLERVYEGEVVLLAERTDVDIPINVNTEIMVERIGPLHIVSLDGQVMFQAQDNLLASGGVGFFAWAMESVSFLDIHVTRPTAP
ncbi:MAG: MopE-related protein [Myxococcota bacterium]